MLKKLEHLVSKTRFFPVPVEGISTSTKALRFNKFDLSYTQFNTKEVNDRIQLLKNQLPSGSDIIYRGSEGSDEILDLLVSNRLGKNFAHNTKLESLDIVDYIRNNDSRYLLSFSPCKETAKPYAAGLSVVPCKGHIIVTGLPKVYTIPHKLLYLNEEMFKRYDRRQHNETTNNQHAYQSIVTMTQNNNEITAVLGISEKDDWRPVVSEDLMSIFEVCGPGRILSKFMSANEIAYVKEWKNPDYTRRIYAIEIVIAESPDDLKSMNSNAQQMRLINSNERLITIDDAKVLLRSGKLDELNELYKTSETQRISSVPKNIAIGDQAALVAFVTTQLKANPQIEERQELQTPIITTIE